MCEDLFGAPSPPAPPSSGEPRHAGAERDHGMAERHFLGWGQPMLPLVTEWLWHRRETFPDLLVIVPTAESGRKLREQLAQRGGYLSPRFLTAGQYAREAWSGTEPPPLVERCLWVEALNALSWERWEPLFKQPKGEDWQGRFAEELTTLRQRLSQYDLNAQKVLSTLPDTHPDRGRWTFLTFLEERFFRLATQWGVREVFEPQLRSDNHLGKPSLVVAGVTDPNEWMVRSLREIDPSKARLEILVHAPADWAEHFDAFGRPLTEYWENHLLEWLGTDQNHHLSTNPAAMAQQVTAVLGQRASGPLALGVGDPSFHSDLHRALQKEGLRLYDPAGESLRGHGLTQWLRTVHSFLAQDTLTDLLALSSSSWTARLLSWSPCELYETAAALQLIMSDTVVQKGEDLWYLQKAGWPLHAPHPAPQKALRQVLDFLRPLRQALQVLRSAESVSSLESFLSPLLAGQDASLAAVVLEQIRLLQDQESLLPTPQRSTLDFLKELSESLGKARLSSRSEEVHLESSGWMELAYEPAPQLLIAGMNEGIIPLPLHLGVWLPEALQTTLGMRTSQDRFAHDLYYAHSLIEPRRTDGYIATFFSQYAAGGEPLMPSRLLLQCPKQQLAARTMHCFSSPPYALKSPPWQREWILQAPLKRPSERIGVTAFKDYLTCPFRYYLKHVLKMQRPGGTFGEWDHRSFGTLLHEVLESLQTDPEALATRDQSVLTQWLWQKLDEVLEGQIKDLPLVLQIQREAMRQRLRFFADIETQQRLEDAGDWQTVGWEESFELSAGDAVIRGTIDRVDQHRDGRYRLIDYKTGRVASPEKEHLAPRSQLPEHLEEAPVLFTQRGKDYYWKNLQLPLYALAYYEKTGQYPEVLYCHLAESRESTQFMRWDFHEELGNSARQTMLYLAGQIQNEVFWPPASRGKRDFDDYRELTFGYRLEESLNLNPSRAEQ